MVRNGVIFTDHKIQIVSIVDVLAAPSLTARFFAKLILGVLQEKKRQRSGEMEPQVSSLARDVKPRDTSPEVSKRRHDSFSPRSRQAPREASRDADKMADFFQKVNKAAAQSPWETQRENKPETKQEVVSDRGLAAAHARHQPIVTQERSTKIKIELGTKKEREPEEKNSFFG